MKKLIWHGERIKKKYRSAVPKALTIVGAQATTFVKDLTPVDTGLLKSSIAFATTLKDARATSEGGEMAKSSELIDPPDDSFHLKIGTAVKYSADVEFGTKAHTVKAKNKPFLHFPIKDKKSKKILGWVKKKSVKIPAKKAVPFLRPGVLNNQNVLGKLFAKSMRGLVK